MPALGQDANYSGILDGNELDNSCKFSSGMIWNPNVKLTVGVEYLRGQRENKDRAAGAGNR
ncbi:hypothetical protein D3OALGA1CA_3873 [Olavius algarvensis associated proteobacterium Delta 3]|nr:hypothetical protein D3OALGA1CA_3873 [Olavius algarvensis associated proteobacterium Delta 3]CAB5166922.1 hypothetical protein D3OALGB2SA_5823 [Olavius algarvensis associated proteobacterium Delta 3]